MLLQTFFPRTKGQINKMIKTNEKAAALEVDLDHVSACALEWQGVGVDHYDQDDGTALTPLDGDVRGGRGRGRGKGKRRGTRRTRREAPGDESRSESEPDEAALRRRKRKEEQLAAIKSAQFVESDEDAVRVFCFGPCGSKSGAR